MSAAPSDARPSRRDRLRSATLREITEAGRAQLRTVGPQGLTLSAVARELGMTAPALYRYVDGVDGLLTLLIAEGYADLADHVEQARDAVPTDDPGGRFDAAAYALREWALADRAQFGLLFGTPLPGYHAPEDGATSVGAHRAAGVVWQVLVEAHAAGRLGPPLVTEVEVDALPMLEDEHSGALLTLPVETRAAGWVALSLLLGSVAVEVFGHMPACSGTTARAVFAAKVQVARCVVGLPAPR
jgi:AcrR family transcriptional regulator